MAHDTNYLAHVGNIWYFDFRIPKKYKKFFKKDRLRHSLNTSDVKQAIALKNKYLLPVVSAMCAKDFVENALAMIDTINLDLDRKTKDLLQFLLRRDEGEKMTLRELCNYSLSCYERSQKADASIAKIGATSNALCSILGDETIAEEVTAKDIIHFRDTILSMPVGWQKRAHSGNLNTSPSKKNEKKMNPNSVRYDVHRAKAIFARAIADRKVIMDNPADNIKLDTVEPVGKNPPAGEDIEKLCTMKLPHSKNYDAEAWQYLPLFARYTGCRIGELVILKAEDIVQKQGIQCLHITAVGKSETERQKLKTKSSERYVPVSNRLTPHLNFLLKNHKEGYIFPKCGNWYNKAGKIRKPAHSFLKDYNRYAKRINPGNSYSFHCWRVYANTAMADAGTDILDREMVLGHKSERVQRSYTTENVHRLKKAVDTII